MGNNSIIKPHIVYHGACDQVVSRFSGEEPRYDEAMSTICFIT